METGKRNNQGCEAETEGKSRAERERDQEEEGDYANKW